MDKDQYASEDESDQDFNPGDINEDSLSEEVSEEESDQEDIESANKKSKRNKNSVKSTLKISKTSTEDNTRHTRQSENAENGAHKKAKEMDNLESDEEEDKTRTDALWADFLSDVKVPAKEAVLPNSSNDNLNKSKSNQTTSIQNKSLAADGTSKTRIVTEVLDFAGEEVRVQKSIKADNIKENKVDTTPATSFSANKPSIKSSPLGGIKRPSTGSAGLGSLVTQLGKKKKLSVLEKSQMDWNSYKQDEGINEELQTFNKGKDGYLERQDFLQRTDVRQFEIEKNLRQNSRRPH